jgi:HlyD family secretion protein
VKVGQQVKVFTDDGKGGFKETAGEITWINDRSEFTPKTIQTKNERANLVYAIKVSIKNDGYYKIGMYGQVNWNNH